MAAASAETAALAAEDKLTWNGRVFKSTFPSVALAGRNAPPYGAPRPTDPWRPFMSEHVYKTIELVGSSPVGAEQAIANAIAKASETVRNLRWFEVVETRGHIEGGKVAHWQVTLKIGFTLDNS
jgi:dodecin